MRWISNQLKLFLRILSKTLKLSQIKLLIKWFGQSNFNYYSAKIINTKRNNKIQYQYILKSWIH